MSHLKKKKKSGYENLLNKRKRDEEQKNAPKITQYYAKDAKKSDSETAAAPCSNDTSSREDSELAVAFPDNKHVVEAVSLPDSERAVEDALSDREHVANAVAVLDSEHVANAAAVLDSEHAEEPATLQDSKHAGETVGLQDSEDVAEAAALSQPKGHTDESTKVCLANSEHEEAVKDSIDVFNFVDPGLWPETFSHSIRQAILEMGPKQIKDFNFPRDSSGRKFSHTYYNRHLKNGEECNRNWLVYSISKNSVYCFCCKLFELRNSKHNKFIQGQNDWQHLAMYLDRHEKKSSHLNNYKKWTELTAALKSKTCIDYLQQLAIDKEGKRWYEVIKRIIFVIQFLATQNLAFRGKSNKLYERNNGNFLKCIEMLEKFDPFILEHTRRVTKDADFKNMPSYLGDKIQNEILALLASNIKNHIIDLCQQNKYFSVILDCTPDVSHTEQISVIFRFVHFNSKNKKVEVREHFLAFFPILDATGAGLCSFLTDLLKTLNLDISNLRGQGYDNGANMRGKNIGLQKRILNLNPRAFYVPCSNHSLNLIINDAANINHETIGFFTIIQELYKLFSSSTYRWDILTKHVDGLTLKPLSETRWSSRIDAIKPLFKHLPEVYDALFEIYDSSKLDEQIKYQAKCLAEKIATLSFICCVRIWHDILNQVNFVNKILQTSSMNTQRALDALNDLNKFLNDYRSDDSFKEIVESSKLVAKEIDAECVFFSKRPLRRRKKTKQFDYEHEDEIIENPEISFKVNFFLRIIDQSLASLQERFTLLKEHMNSFQFLYMLSTSQNKETLLRSCKQLQQKLTHENQTDIDAEDLCEEILHCLPSISNFKNDIYQIIQYIYENDLTTVYPNFTISLRILLTLPVSVASAERSFSKLKIIKNYLRSTMVQDRLSNLATLSIESDILNEFDIHHIIRNFSLMKARKVKFIK